MNFGALNKIGALLLRFLDPKKATEPVAVIPPQKTDIVKISEEEFFPRATPESCGISSADIFKYIEAIKNDTSLNMHNIMILRKGTVVFECSFKGSDIKIPKMTFSACKSITSLAVGMLIDEGKLSFDESVFDIFGDEINFIDRKKMSSITVRDLLTMRSSVVFNEAEALVSQNYLKGFFSSSTSGKVGETFNYNSLNTYVLSAIVLKRSGEHISKYLEKRLFSPLGIKDYMWETCPMGIEKGGWGLYISPENIAKIGMLVMNGGVFDGKRIVSENYIKEALTPHAKAPKDYGAFNYGYQIWVGRDTNTFLFNGMLGQNVLGFLDNGIIVVSNAGNGELFQQGNFYSLTLSTFGKNIPDKLMPNRRENSKLCALKKSLVYGEGQNKLKNQKSVINELLKYLPQEFVADSENAASFGLMPAILQVAQNNYSLGTKSIGFDLDRENLLLDIKFKEKGAENRFSAGLLKAEKSIVSFGGERYRISSFARFTHDEDENPVLVLNIDFTETPCSRVLKFFFRNGGMVCFAEELPGADFIVKNANEMIDELLENKLLSLVSGVIDKEYILYKFEKIFSPKISFRAKK